MQETLVDYTSWSYVALMVTVIYLSRDILLYLPYKAYATPTIYYGTYSKHKLRKQSNDNKESSGYKISMVFPDDHNIKLGLFNPIILKRKRKLRFVKSRVKMCILYQPTNKTLYYKDVKLLIYKQT